MWLNAKVYWYLLSLLLKTIHFSNPFYKSLKAFSSETFVEKWLSIHKFSWWCFRFFSWFYHFSIFISWNKIIKLAFTCQLILIYFCLIKTYILILWKNFQRKCFEYLQVGFVYLFNLIVGTGALTMPLAFQNAGWMLSLIVIVLLAGFR